ncbi:MAG: DMT family transporter [Verrucomicrobiaceae bacterium]|nr:DMT family transporter [Verrucomicrobiaceae bacterium]
MYLLAPLLSALIYPFASLFLKRAIGEGAGLLRTAFLSNIVLFAIFLPALLFTRDAPQWAHLGWPLLAGLCFFGGQVFTFLAIRSGDVSIQAPLMGIKVIFVALFSFFLKPDEVPPLLWVGSALTAMAIFLLGGASLKSLLENSRTVIWSLIACACFGGSDSLAGYRSADFGRIPFLIIMVSVVAIGSLALVPFFSAPLRGTPRPARNLAMLGGMAIGLQGIILNLSLVFIGQATAMNIVYSTRALWGVLLIWLIGHKLGNHEAAERGHAVMTKRLAGACLLSAAVMMIFL